MEMLLGYTHSFFFFEGEKKKKKIDKGLQRKYAISFRWFV